MEHDFEGYGWKDDRTPIEVLDGYLLVDTSISGATQESISIEDQLRAIRSVIFAAYRSLDALKAEIAEMKALPTHSERDSDDYLGLLSEYPYLSSAASLTTVSLYCSFLEIVLSTFFRKIGADYGARLKKIDLAYDRWADMREKDRWDISKKLKGSKLGKIGQALEIADNIGLIIADDQKRVIEALTQYRNAMLHNALEWPATDLARFERRVYPNDWFERASSDGVVKIFSLSTKFRGIVDETIQSILNTMGVFLQNLNREEPVAAEVVPVPTKTGMFANLKFNARGYEFQESIGVFRDSFATAMTALRDQAARIDTELEEYLASQERGEPWIGERAEEGYVLWDQEKLLEMQAEAAQLAIVELRKSYAIAIYHAWERALRAETGYHKHGHDGLVVAAAKKGIAESPDLEKVRCLANALKHSNDDKGRELFKVWKDVFPSGFDPDTPGDKLPAWFNHGIDWHQVIHLEDVHIEQVLKAVSASGPVGFPGAIAAEENVRQNL